MKYITICITAIIFTFFIAPHVLSGIPMDEPGQGIDTITPEPDHQHIIIAYVAGWREWASAHIDAEKLTHINYAFADIKDGKLNSYLDNDEYNFAMLDSLRLRNPGLKILVSVGGWSRSTYFSDAAFTEESRAIFSESALEFIKRYNLDGIDLDWEYPGNPGAGNVFRAADRENFTLLLQELRVRLDRQTVLDGREENPYLLTIATGASQGFLQNTEMHKAQQYLDYVLLMTYDYHTGGSPVAGHHANLFRSQNPHYTRGSADQSVQWFIDAGIPSEKLVLGVAFYGRYWTNARPVDNGLYQFAPGSDRGAAGFDRLKEEFINKNGFTRYWDAEAKAPWLWNPDTGTFWSYDDEESIQHKTNYIKARGLGGAMFWEYSQNLNGELLDVLYNGLKQE
jgi:chitinase